MGCDKNDVLLFFILLFVLFFVLFDFIGLTLYSYFFNITPPIFQFINNLSNYKYVLFSPPMIF